MLATETICFAPIRTSGLERPHVVTIGSVKSCYGHTEGAAGLTGALLALAAMRSQAAAPIMHLRNTNPYVESSFGDWQKAHCLAPRAPRAAGPLPLTAAADPELGPLAGTSSFGMSGVNAHGLFEALPPRAGPRDEHGAPAFGQAALRRERHWGLAPVFCLADRALPAASEGRCSMLVDLAKPALAFLWDHQARRGRNWETDVA